MNAMDVIGYMDAGCTLCADCGSDDEREGMTAVFCTDETDSPSHCDRCEDLIHESLTTDGERGVCASVQAALEGRGGRKCILRQWIAAYSYLFDDRPALKTLARSWPATDEYSPKMANV